MWNAPLINGTGLSISTDCALVLLGLSFGLLVAGFCLAFVAALDDHRASSSEGSYAYISDDEIEIVIELVRDAVAGSGWTLCGDCYTRNLLMQLSFPVQESVRGCLSSHREQERKSLTTNAEGEKRRSRGARKPAWQPPALSCLTSRETPFV